MVLMSTMRPILQSALLSSTKTIAPIRSMSGHGPRIFPMQPSRWQWNRFKDLMNMYVIIGLIPVTAVVMYANIFIGPATLSEIPEGYTPKYWEYHNHPITRFLSKHLFHNPQQEYEKYMHHIFEEDEKRSLRGIEKEVKKKMAERHDFKSYYYRPVLAKYHRKSKEDHEYLERIRGD